MKLKLVLLASYFIITPIFIFALIFYQLFLLHQEPSFSGKVLGAQDTKISYSVVPPEAEKTQVTLSPKEARVAVLEEFFGRYSSPLKDYAQAIVDAADNYELDYRLLPAIAMQESTLCQKIPDDSHNCWGFGIYGGKVTKFSDYGEAINVVSKAMARDYHGQGLQNPSEIVSKYTPANTNDWAQNVSYVMERISARLDSPTL